MGDTARTADANWPKGCFTPHRILLSNTSWDRGRRKDREWLPRWPVFRDWLGISLPMAHHDGLTSFGWLGFFSFFLHLLNKLYLSPRVVSVLFFLFSPSALLEWQSEQAAMWVLGCWPASAHHSHFWHLMWWGLGGLRWQIWSECARLSLQLLQIFSCYLAG